MDPDGSNATLVLLAEPPVGGKEIHHLDAQLSPGGGALAYVRQEDLSDGSVGGDELWSVDLSTGAKRDLGAMPSSDLAFVWKDSSTILAQTPDEGSLDWIDVATGDRNLYLAATDPQLVQAFHQARPEAGPPTGIGPLGWSTDQSQTVTAVYLTAADGETAIAMLGNTRAQAFAPDHRYDLSFSWGLSGAFEITSFSGDNMNAGSGVYVGQVGSSQLQVLPGTGVTAAVAFDPTGQYLMVESQAGNWSVYPAPPASCLVPGTCPRPASTSKLMLGDHLQGWAS